MEPGTTLYQNLRGSELSVSLGFLKGKSEVLRFYYDSLRKLGLPTTSQDVLGGSRTS